MFKAGKLFSVTTLVATLGLCSLGAGSALAETVTITGKLAASSEVPPNASAGVGTLDANLDKASSILKWTVTYSGLTGPVKAGHFHGPAPAGQNAGVALGFSGSMDSPIQGTATLTAAQVADLLAGKWYVNLHTAANPGGEIRGQATAAP